MTKGVGMRILLFGAGNIGCLYAALLTRSGQDVTLLARGDRYTDLQRHGITVQHALSGARTTSSVSVIDRLTHQDAYDLMIVTLPSYCLDDALPTLAANE